MPTVSSDVLTLYRGLRACVNQPNLLRDVTARQMAVFLACSIEAAITVKTLHQRLGVPKPAVVRALDKLCDLKLLRRLVRHEDNRQIEVFLTAAATFFMSNLHDRMNGLRIVESSSRSKKTAQAGGNRHSRPIIIAT